MFDGNALKGLILLFQDTLEELVIENVKLFIIRKIHLIYLFFLVSFNKYVKGKLPAVLVFSKLLKTKKDS